MSAYYNEFDPFAAAWLRELIADGLIAPGDVDERDIRKVQPDELRSYIQIHLFAGIGGWSRALRLAGWPDDRPVWTGSCPCQPFSSAGKQKGAKDKRHLWPWMRHLIFRCRPAVAFGEQVASNLGRDWLAGVRGNLETLGYAVGAADLCAASIGAPHIRQRLWWVAHSEGQGRARVESERPGAERIGPRPRCGSAANGLGNADGSAGPRLGSDGDGVLQNEAADIHRASGTRIIRCRDGKSRRIPLEPALFPLADGLPGRVGMLRGAGNAIHPEAVAAFIQAFVDISN